MMSNIIGGWAGKVLRVNLTTNTISYDPIEKYYDYIGGMGRAGAYFVKLI
mgnify:CR=1 FL=1